MFLNDFLGNCPVGVAWVDKAYATDSAHQLVPCSNAGVCNVVTGMCNCYSGFTGLACQRSMCIFIVALFLFVQVRVLMLAVGMVLVLLSGICRF